MHIADNSYNLNSRFTKETSGAVQPKTAAQLSSGDVSGNSQLVQVSEGQMFHGEILNITNNDVSIMLDNSKTLLAHMSEAVNLNIGDSLTFLVKENSGSSVVITPYQESEGSMKDSAIFKALDMNNLSPTEKNYQIAENLMQRNMPVDRAGMQRIMQQAYKYPDASVSTLVALNKLGIPVDENSIRQYEAYMTNTHQLAGDVIRMADGIADWAAEAVSELLSRNEGMGAGDILAFHGGMLADLSDDADMPALSLSEGMPQADMGEDTIPPSTEPAKDTGGDNQTSLLADRLSLKEEAVKNLLDGLARLGADAGELQGITKHSETPLRLLNNINKLLSEQTGKAMPSGEEIQKLLESDGYKQILREAVRQKFTLDGERMENPKELDDLYKSIYDKTSKLMNTFAGAGGEAGKHLQQQAKGMQERLDFIQNLNQMYAYAQLPVNLSGRDMNSELFVYMNKRRMKDAKEAVSALLHLDMEHLGATDVHVSLHGSVVHTRFYVEDAVSAQIIDDHMNMLEKAINESGFSLTNEVITREPSLQGSPNMAVQEMLGKDTERSIGRYSFDVRT